MSTLTNVDYITSEKNKLLDECNKLLDDFFKDSIQSLDQDKIVMASMNLNRPNKNPYHIYHEFTSDPCPVKWGKESNGFVYVLATNPWPVTVAKVTFDTSVSILKKHPKKSIIAEGKLKGSGVCLCTDTEEKIIHVTDGTTCWLDHKSADGKYVVGRRDVTSIKLIIFTNRNYTDINQVPDSEVTCCGCTII